MSQYVFSYLYNNKYANELILETQKNRNVLNDISVTVVENGLILPGNSNVNNAPAWGAGGVLDADGNFIEKSGVPLAFGGKYSFNIHDIDIIDDEVIHINIIPKHWGHFLVDVVCRLWYLLENNSQCKITYCSWKFEDHQIKGNFLEFFKILGISEDRLVCINKPTRVKKINIPDATYKFCGDYNEKYRTVLRKVCESVSNGNDNEISKKLYLTRTKLKKAKFYETGEKEIEDIFRLNGFEIVSPEKLSLQQQISLFMNAEMIVSLSGTLPHNIVFTKPQTEIIILNRTCLTNLPQIGFNELFDGRVTYIDVYNRVIENKPVIYGDGPLWVECNSNLEAWLSDNGYDQRISKFKKIFAKIRNFCVWKMLKIVHYIYRKRK